MGVLICLQQVKPMAKMNDKPQILLTNDDGIQSPGLFAAAQALSEIGYVNVVAPREQQSGAGRSLPFYSDGIINPQKIQVKDQPWTVYAVGGTPAQAVLHGVLEILDSPPDLVVSGINYGQNVGSGVTISGTIGAALEAASHDIPALAVSLETDDRFHLSYSTEIDFSAAAYFTCYFSRILLRNPLPDDVDVLKIDVPAEATPETPWEITRVSRARYYESYPQPDRNWGEPGKIHYRQGEVTPDHPHDSDVYVLSIKRHISVTPLSLDMTSRTSFQDLDARLRRSLD